MSPRVYSVNPSSGIHPNDALTRVKISLPAGSVPSALSLLLNYSPHIHRKIQPTVQIHESRLSIFRDRLFSANASTFRDWFQRSNNTALVSHLPPPAITQILLSSTQLCPPCSLSAVAVSGMRLPCRVFVHFTLSTLHCIYINGTSSVYGTKCGFKGVHA